MSLPTPSKERINTKVKGNIGEAIFLAEFQKRNIQTSIPFGDNARYDLIIDVNDKLYKVQIKYCNQKIINQSVCVPCSSSMNHTTNKGRKKYKDDVDFIGAYIKEWNLCCLIPIEDINDKCQIQLRKEPTIFSKDYHLADDYSIDKILCVETLHSNSDSE